ncbi:hypothetical protein ACCO45_011588 [Purpureocillium lilacinum]|uniref:Uncharacterized protein n=1 Tax=Purpureocillium lilacinum TaxID=33203 RepID=A0ACC4DBA9_PURLI
MPGPARGSLLESRQSLSPLAERSLPRNSGSELLSTLAVQSGRTVKRKFSCISLVVSNLVCYRDRVGDCIHPAYAATWADDPEGMPSETKPAAIRSNVPA